jgi:hypothetical protein
VRAVKRCVFCGDPPVYTGIAHTHDDTGECPGKCEQVHVCERCADIMIRRAREAGLRIRDRRTQYRRTE